MASSLVNALSSLAWLRKNAALREDVPTYDWAMVQSVSGKPTVILEMDEKAEVRPVHTNAVGYLEVGWRVRVEQRRGRLTIVAAPQQTAVTGWTPCDPVAGFTGTMQVCKVGLVKYFRADVTGTFPEGNTQFCVIPPDFRPTLNAPLAASITGGQPGSGLVWTNGSAFLTQRTGASRTQASLSGSWR